MRGQAAATAQVNSEAGSDGTLARAAAKVLPAPYLDTHYRR